MLRNFQVFIPIRGSDSGTIAACERPAPLADLRATIPLVVLFHYEHLAPVELAGPAVLPAGVSFSPGGAAICRFGALR